MTAHPRLRLPLGAAVPNRDAQTRERADLLAHALGDPTARVLVVWRDQVLVAAAEPSRAEAGMPEREGFELAWFSPGECAGPGETYFLGRQHAGVSGQNVSNPPVLVWEVPERDAVLALRADAQFQPLRSVAHLLNEVDAAWCVQAVALLNWHERSVFSPRTGRATVVQQGGWMRHDPETLEQEFPRTDPAVIVLVRDRDDRLLLGAGAQWEPGRFSLLAGFVEAGESLEAAVAREVFEESGLRVADISYVASQPWPFPRSLMIGFSARLERGQDPAAAQPDGAEVIALRWYSRAELRAAVAGSEPSLILPGPSSIARAMIEHWLAEDA